MRTIIQRVTQAAVTINDTVKSQIENGLMLLVGFEETDTQEDLTWLAAKICKLRIFDDKQGIIMNLSIQDVDFEISSRKKMFP